MSVPGATTSNEIYYPILPDDTDFETYRKTDPHYKAILQKCRPSIQSGVLDDGKVDIEESQRTRFIFQLWPRDPNGEILRETPEGKTTSNGLELWGATLYDFFFVHRIPGVIHMRTISSGSKLAKWMRLKGETYSMDYIDQVESDEHEPKIMHPYHIGDFIELIEQQVHLKKTGRSLKVDKTIKEKVSLCSLLEVDADYNISDF